MEIQELKALIKESMREVLREERLILCKILMPYVDDTEQAELEAEFCSPADYSEDETVSFPELNNPCPSLPNSYHSVHI